MASASSPEMKKYDVFLSFRGEDTRKNFTAHLNRALEGAGIRTFVEEETLKKGNEISSTLLKAIEESKLSIVVFSQQYAFSSWCLDELVKILECKQKMGLIVVPVFYHVDPSAVRRQEGAYGNAFAKHRKIFKGNLGKVNKWKLALTEASYLSGWDLTNGPESKAIHKIVEHISKILDQTFVGANEDLVGMASRVRKVESFLDLAHNAVRTIGIWGMNGLGKTTLANIVFERIHHQFEASSFVANVREESEKHGIVHLQTQLYKTLMKTKANIQDVSLQADIMRSKLSSRKVLLVLDDVDALEQIEALAGKAAQQHAFFGQGSRVIVTTRDMPLLKKYGVNDIYEVEKLTDDEAFQLFFLRAFKGSNPLNHYRELSENVVKYACGHPLAVKVLSSFPYAGDMNEWFTILSHVDEIPEDTRVHKILRLHYDALCWNEKQILLDIACFFIGEDLSRVNMILESCNFSPTSGIGSLVEKSLITVNDGRLCMHDLVRELAWAIISQESLEEPGRRSRLWSFTDAFHVLQQNKETRDVEGLFLCFPKEEEKHVHLKSDPFSEMKNLRILKICNVNVSGFLENDLSENLRLLEWHKYPLKSLPSGFEANKLVELVMPYSRVELLWKEARFSEKLRVINLSNCQYLKKTPDFSMTPNLEKLNLEGCKRLLEVHPSLGVLKRLVSLNMESCELLERLPQKISLSSLKTLILSGCSNLNKFPEIVGSMENLSELYLEETGVYMLPTSMKQLSGLILLNLKNCKSLQGSFCHTLLNLTSLRVLYLSGCSKVDRLPENLGNLEHLEELFVNGTTIRKMPTSILLLKNLKVLSFRGCKDLQLPNSFSGLWSLITLDLSQCNLSQGAIPDDIDCLSSLVHLDLSENNFVNLPESISQLSMLRELCLSKCKRLQSLPKLPLSLRYVVAQNCPMLAADSSADLTIQSFHEGLRFIDRQKLSSANEDWTRNTPVFIPGEHTDIILSKLIEELIGDQKQFEIRFPCSRIPDWCSNWSNDCSLVVALSVEDKNIMKGFALFFIFVIKEHDNLEEGWELKKILCDIHIDEGGHENSLRLENFEHFRIGSFGICCFIPQERLNKASRFIRASVSTDRLDLEFKMCGLHLVSEQDIKKFSEHLSQTAVEFYDVVSNFSRHCDQLLDGAPKLESLCNLVTNGYNLQERQCMAKEMTCEAEQQSSPCDICSSGNQSSTSDLTLQTRRDLQPLLLRLFQGWYARTCSFHFLVPLRLLSPFFLHHCLGNVAVCYFPPNLCNERRWVGLEVYVLFTRRPAASSRKSNLDEKPSLIVDLYGHGNSTLPILTYSFVIDDLFGSLFVVYHLARECFQEKLNQCKGISALFRPNTSDVEIEMCGARLLYEQDSEVLVQAIIECTLGIPDVVRFVHHQAEINIKVAEDFLHNVGIGDYKALKQELPHLGLFSSCQRELIEFWQRLLTSNEQLAKEVSTSLQKYGSYLQDKLCYNEFDPILLHSKHTFFENWDLLEEIAAEDTFRGLISGFNHLHIMAETVLYGGDPEKWKRNLVLLLTEFFNDFVMVTLSVKGHIISMSKPFDPCSTYNFSFPRKEILQWFEHQSSTSMMEIELSPNLYNDNNWWGLVICASFSVHERPTNYSDTSFKLLCHLTSNGYCLNPVSLFSVAKENFKWLYVRGFIWLTYLPRVLLMELNGQRNVGARIYSYCPDLIVKKCGIRLLYQQDVEEFKQAIINCWTSFFDNLTPISHFVADESEASSC